MKTHLDTNCRLTDLAWQKALEIARREFPELRDVPEEKIYFSMFVTRHATGLKWSGVMQSRISPGVWETFFETTTLNDKGITVLFIDVEKPKKRGWAERLGLAKDESRKVDAKNSKKSEGGADLPSYTKAAA